MLPAHLLRAARAAPLASKRAGGIYDDQASSVLDAIAQGPSRNNPPVGSMMCNPGPAALGDLPDAKTDSNMVRAQLIEIAYLITGEWSGMSKAPSSYVVMEDGRPKSIPLDISNAPGTFKARMSALADVLTGHLDRLSGRKTDWNNALAKLLRAVEHCIAGKPLLQIPPGEKEPVKGSQAIGQRWGALADSGNKKLPFFAYSELPAVTCPGSGACLVWCYSLKAWRYPHGFVRQALNTLAARYDEHLHKDPANRVWAKWILAQTWAKSARQRKAGPVFFRLFVDGDFYDASTLVAWMNAVKEVASTRDERGIEAYGYSKSWHFFLDLDKAGYKWPTNYVVNASSGSRYAKYLDQFLRLPVVRGEFRAIKPEAYWKELAEQAKGNVMPKTSSAEAQKRIQAFVELNGIQSAEGAFDAAKFLSEKYGLGALEIKTSDRKDLAKVRAEIFWNWIQKLAKDPIYRAEAIIELAKDQGLTVKGGKFYNKKGEAKAFSPGNKALSDKLLAMHLHEVLWAYGLGGSCPLVCGNCSDEIDPNKQGVHRCAAKPGSLFWNRPIHIGLH